MSDPVTFLHTGAREQAARIRAIARNFKPKLGAALYQEGQIETTEVKKRTPVDKGTLRGTVTLLGPFWKGNVVYVLIVAGGPAAPYAIYVHENLEAIHKVGQAKFIESVILESAPYMPARVLSRLDRQGMVTA